MVLGGDGKEIQEDGLSTPPLSADEKQQARGRTSVTATVVHETIRMDGDEELQRTSSALAWSGLAAGLSMGFSLVAEALLRSHLPNQPWRPLVSKLGYPFGFLIVILGRQQLFTENTLTAVIPLLARRNWATFLGMLRLWGVVLLANLAGAHLFAWTVGNTTVFGPEMKKAFEEIGREAIAVGFGSAVLRGVFAGWLIAMVVWIVAAIDQGRIAVIVILTYLVGLGRFTHVIAGSVEVLYLVMTGQAAWTTYLGSYMVPTILGNILGGVSLVSALNHAQVVAGRQSSST